MKRSGAASEAGVDMGIGVSIFLMAVGAILTWAVNVEASGININTVGVILMIVGLLGLLLSIAFWSSFSPWNRRSGDRTVIRDREVL
jgi:hypothetical protein